MEPFNKSIKGIDFVFQGNTEGEDEICWIKVDSHSFKMTVDDQGEWQILQQVPAWIKAMEKDLAKAIDEGYN
ncbi:MAG TPA: hypothetical protein VHK91_16195 [Flavisolibacter sp.]|nr:hypothetical protein [Flavisolibacter sp.]